MPVEVPDAILRMEYFEAAQEYLRKLPLEHFMESTPQATQREITVESLALVRARRSEVHVFNELLVQYPLPQGKIGQVVPDNMVVLHDGPIEAVGSYDVPLEPAHPLWVLEYVSKSNRRKDYEDNMRRYARELKVPYYLLFEPDKETMTLFRQGRGRYAAVKANDDGRYAIPELEIEVAMLDGWVRFWYQGELLPLPADLLRQLDVTRRELRETKSELHETKSALAESERRREALEREVAELRARGKNGKH